MAVDGVQRSGPQGGGSGQVSFAALVFWCVELLDKLCMWLSPKYKASCFYADMSRMRDPHDHEFNAMMYDILAQQYGYREKKTPGI